MGKAHFEQFSFDQLHFRVICSWLNDDCLAFAFDSDGVANVDGINVFERKFYLVKKRKRAVAFLQLPSDD